MDKKWGTEHKTLIIAGGTFLAGIQEIAGEYAVGLNMTIPVSCAIGAVASTALVDYVIDPSSKNVNEMNHMLTVGAHAFLFAFVGSQILSNINVPVGNTNMWVAGLGALGAARKAADWNVFNF